MDFENCWNTDVLTHRNIFFYLSIFKFLKAQANTDWCHVKQLDYSCTIPLSVQGLVVISFLFQNITAWYFKIKFPSLPMLQKHPQSSPSCPTRLHDLPGQSGTGSGTAGSHAHDKRSSSVSGHLAAWVQSGTGASHIADQTGNMSGDDKHFKVDTAVTVILLSYL